MCVNCAAWEAFYSCQEVKIVNLMYALFFDSSQEWNQIRVETLYTIWSKTELGPLWALDKCLLTLNWLPISHSDHPIQKDFYSSTY